MEYKKGYRVSLKRSEWGSIVVRAKNSKEAENIAFEELENGNICWNKEEIEECYVEKE